MEITTFINKSDRELPSSHRAGTLPGVHNPPPIPPLPPERLMGDIVRGMRLSPLGIHGLRHWARVHDLGLLLAPRTGADPLVVSLFAVFHDSRRHNDFTDPEHGPRGAALAEQFRKEHLTHLTDAQFIQLTTACRLHTSARTHEDPTIATCFDADRLDLARVGTTPHPARLCTTPARDPDLIARACAAAAIDTANDLAAAWIRALKLAGAGQAP